MLASTIAQASESNAIRSVGSLLHEATRERPEDTIPDLPENAETREFLKSAPSKGLWMPLGKEVKVMQCWRCKQFGHRTGDKECPLYAKGNLEIDSSRQALEDPMSAFVASRGHSGPSVPSSSSISSSISGVRTVSLPGERLALLQRLIKEIKQEDSAGDTEHHRSRYRGRSDRNSAPRKAHKHSKHKHREHRYHKHKHSKERRGTGEGHVG